MQLRLSKLKCHEMLRSIMTEMFQKIIVTNKYQNFEHYREISVKMEPYNPWTAEATVKWLYRRKSHLFPLSEGSVMNKK